MFSMFRIPDSKSNHWFISSHKVAIQVIHGELVVAVGSRVSRKTVVQPIKTAASLISLGSNNC